MIKKKFFIWILFVYVICMGTALFFSIENSRGTLENSYENDTRVISGLISNVLENNFLRPITVAETISKDITTKKIVSIQNEAEAYAIEAEAAEYLKSLRDGFGYSMVFIVSDPGKTYFTYNGISKFIDVEHDERDEWYKNFLAADEKYVLDVDTDEAANWSLSVFVNTAVYDDAANLIGVCGVGIDMTELRSLLEKYERIYNVKIDLINEDGLIQVDTDMERIERDRIEIEDLKKYSDGENYYEVLADGSRTITYLEDLKWYLVVKNNNTVIQNVARIIWPGAVCIVLGMIVAIGIYVIGMRGNKENIQ